MNKTTGLSTQSRLVLIDLAGSERIAKSGVSGVGEREAANINLSLTTLNKVIYALQNKERSIPFRESKLTMLLADCLGGDSKCLMFCNVSPNASNYSETVSSLEFAKRASETQLGKAQRSTTNTTITPAAMTGPMGRMTMQPASSAQASNPAQQKQIKSLTDENQKFKEKVQQLEGQCGDLKQQIGLIEQESLTKDRQYNELYTRHEKLERELQKLTQQQQRQQQRLSQVNSLSNAEVGKLYDQQRRSTLHQQQQQQQNKRITMQGTYDLGPSSSSTIPDDSSLSTEPSPTAAPITSGGGTLRKRKSNEMLATARTSSADGMSTIPELTNHVVKSQRLNNSKPSHRSTLPIPSSGNTSGVTRQPPSSSVRATVGGHGTGVNPLTRRPQGVANSNPISSTPGSGLQKTLSGPTRPQQQQPRGTITGTRPGMPPQSPATASSRARLTTNSNLRR